MPSFDKPTLITRARAALNAWRDRRAMDTVRDIVNGDDYEDWVTRLHPTAADRKAPR